MVRESTACRVCMKKSKDGVPLDTMFCRKPKLNFLDGFNICTQLNAIFDDGLPEYICTHCRDDLKAAFNFIEKARETDKKFRKKLGIALPRSSRNKSIKEEIKDLHDNNEELFADIKTEFISCSKDPLQDSELEDGNDSEHEIDMNWLLETVNESDDYQGNDIDSDNDDDEDDDNMPLKNLLKKDDDLIFNDKIDEQFPEPVTTPETQIFPKGHYVCKICKKTYFTEAGLKSHISVHMPKKKKIKKQKTERRKRKKKSEIFLEKIEEDTQDENIKGQEDERIKKEGTSDCILDSETANKDIVNQLLTNENLTIAETNNDGKKKRKEKVPKPKKTFPCHVCGKLMISASKLRYHMVMHTGEKDYLCTQCPKAYSTIYALKHHMRTHTGERPYECKFCGDKFTRPTTLKSHLRRHTGERPYGCDICGKRFIQHSSMTTHMKLNHMAKNIPCPHCDKKYARQTDLNTHLLSHTGDKPFSCSLCPSRFIRQANLNKHMNIHHLGAKGGVKTNTTQAAVNAATVAVAGGNSTVCSTIDTLPGTTTTNNSSNSGNNIGNNSMGASSVPSGNNMGTTIISNNPINLLHGGNSNRVDSVDHLKVIHPQVDNLTHLLGQVIDPDRIGRSMEEILRWGWPNNS